MKPLETIEEEICRYLDGSLEDHRQREFESRLASDPMAMDLLCFHAMMDASLRRIPQVRSLTMEISLKREKQRAIRVSLAVAVALVLGVALSLHARMASNSRRLATFETSPGTVFSLHSEGGANRDNLLDPGETLVLSQGLAEITLADGSRCVAEAPAHLTLESKNRFKLSGGRAFFEIAKGSEGFSVVTKDLEVIDLGTAFAIEDSVEFQPQIHVIEGKVRATALSGRRETMELAAGKAAGVGAAGTLRPVVGRGSAFFRELPSGLPSIGFSFDRGKDGLLHATGSIAEQNDIRLFPNDGASAPRSVPGVHGEALGFARRGQSLETNWPGIGGAVPRTVSFWIRIPAGSGHGRILGWGLASGGERMSDMSIVYSGGKRANLRLASGRRWLQTSARLDTGKWHHVAFVTNTPEPGKWPAVVCYLDGVPEPLAKRMATDGEVAPPASFETVTTHPNSRSLAFGDTRDGAQGPPFTGEIDEVRITAGILAEPELRALAGRD